MKARPALLMPLLLCAACRGPAADSPGSQGNVAPAAAPAKSPERPAAAERDGVCNFSGWSVDRDPNGLNVRAGPSADAPVVGRLPPPEYDAGFERAFGVEFQVLESRGGWFRIADARRWSGPGEALPSGWIHGRYLDFALQTDLAFAEPDPSSSVVAAHWEDEQGGHQFGYRHPFECRGEWVRLRVTPRSGTERDGWVRGICGAQETTCDGINGDYPDRPRG